MKKKVKTVCQIIRFRGKIEAFLVSIDLFDIPRCLLREATEVSVGLYPPRFPECIMVRCVSGGMLYLVGYLILDTLPAHCTHRHTSSQPVR